MGGCGFQVKATGVPRWRGGLQLLTDAHNRTNYVPDEVTMTTALVVTGTSACDLGADSILVPSGRTRWPKTQ